MILFWLGKDKDFCVADRSIGAALTEQVMEGAIATDNDLRLRTAPSERPQLRRAAPKGRP